MIPKGSLPHRIRFHRLLITINCSFLKTKQKNVVIFLSSFLSLLSLSSLSPLSLSSPLLVESQQQLSPSQLRPRLDTLAQANWFFAHSNYGELGRMIDLEDSGLYYRGYHGIWPKIKLFCDIAQVETIYASPDYINSCLYDCPQINQYKLIIANWEVSAPKYMRAVETTRWTAFQYTGKGYGNYYGIQAKDAALYVWNGELP